VPFNFSQLLATPDNIFTQYHKYIEKWPDPFWTQVEEVAEISHSCIADKVNNFNDILDALPKYELMPLFEFIPLPVHFNFSGKVSVTPEDGTNNMIAVGHSQSYQLISSSDLQTCNKMGET
jgi:hypothetical protein